MEEIGDIEVGELFNIGVSPTTKTGGTLEERLMRTLQEEQRKQREKNTVDISSRNEEPPFIFVTEPEVFQEPEPFQESFQEPEPFQESFQEPEPFQESFQEPEPEPFQESFQEPEPFQESFQEPETFQESFQEPEPFQEQLEEDALDNIGLFTFGEVRKLDSIDYNTNSFDIMFMDNSPDSLPEEIGFFKDVLGISIDTDSKLQNKIIKFQKKIIKIINNEDISSIKLRMFKTNYIPMLEYIYSLVQKGDDEHFMTELNIATENLESSHYLRSHALLATVEGNSINLLGITPRRYELTAFRIKKIGEMLLDEDEEDEDSFNIFSNFGFFYHFMKTAFHMLMSQDYLSGGKMSEKYLNFFFNDSKDKNVTTIDRMLATNNPLYRVLAYNSLLYLLPWRDEEIVVEDSELDSPIKKVTKRIYMFSIEAIRKYIPNFPIKLIKDFKDYLRDFVDNLRVPISVEILATVEPGIFSFLFFSFLK